MLVSSVAGAIADIYFAVPVLKGRLFGPHIKGSWRQQLRVSVSAALFKYETLALKAPKERA